MVRPVDFQPNAIPICLPRNNDELVGRIGSVTGKFLNEPAISRNLNFPQKTPWKDPRVKVAWWKKLWYINSHTAKYNFIFLSLFVLLSFWVTGSQLSQCFEVRNSVVFLTKTKTKAWLSVLWWKIQICCMVRMYTLRCRTTKLLSQKRCHLAEFCISLYWQRGTCPEKRRDYYLKKSPSSGILHQSHCKRM